MAHSVLISCTLALHSLAGRTVAVADAHVVLLFEVVAWLTLALAVAGSRARRLLDHIVPTNSTSQAFADVIPELGEGTGRTRCALALVSGRAAIAQIRSWRAAVTLDWLSSDWVLELEGLGW